MELGRLPAVTLRVGHRVNRHLVAESVFVFARIAWCRRIVIRARQRRKPAAGPEVGDRWNAQRVAGVAPVVDAVLDGAGEVLIAGQVDDEAFARGSQGCVATLERLRACGALLALSALSRFGQRAVRSHQCRDYKLVEWFEDDRVELYDLAEDVGETEDLAAAMPEKAEELKALLVEWRRRVGAAMPSRIASGRKAALAPFAESHCKAGGWNRRPGSPGVWILPVAPGIFLAAPWIFCDYFGVCLLIR